MRILIAGIGNIFLGDDGFGVEVARLLAQRPWPEGVTVGDFGIRGYDLGLALADGYDAAILVDATPRGQPPGTVFLIEPDLAGLDQSEQASVDGHNLDPARVLQMAHALGGRPGHLYLVGCEPGPLDTPAGRMGLGEAVQSALPQTLELIELLVRDLLKSDSMTTTGAVPA